MEYIFNSKHGYYYLNHLYLCITFLYFTIHFMKQSDFLIQHRRLDVILRTECNTTLQTYNNTPFCTSIYRKGYYIFYTVGSESRDKKHLLLRNTRHPPTPIKAMHRYNSAIPLPLLSPTRRNQ